MSADRELLELAAKAAGYDVRWHEIWQCFVHATPYNTDNPPTLGGLRHVWVPLNDDGDALRLAVKVNISTSIHSEAIFSMRYEDEPAICEQAGGDMYKAMRAAIVKLAAAIGEEMP